MPIQELVRRLLGIRPRRWLSLGLLLLSFAVVLLASSETGPSFEELGRLRAIEKGARVVTLLAQLGPEALEQPEARATLNELGRRTLGVLLAAWARLSVGRVGWLDPLSSARLPWLALGGIAPLLVFAVARRSRGPIVAISAALLLLFMPRYLHAAGLGHENAGIAGAWLLVIAAYQRSLAGAPRRRLCWAFAAAVALGAGAALSLATLWVVPLLLTHFWIAHWAAARRLARRGRLPIPAFVVLGLAVVPVLLIALNPALWRTNPTAIARVLLSALGSEAAGPAADGDLAASGLLGYALSWLVFTLPVFVTVCSALGLWAFAHAGLARRFASGRLRPPRDRFALGALVTLGLVATLVGPAMAPAPLELFPPRMELSLPFVAIAAATGLHAAGRRALGESRAWVFSALVVAVAAWLGLRVPGTGSAAFSPLLGGVEAASERGLPFGDGSELGRLAPVLDAQRATSLVIDAPGVPPELWQELQRARRLRTEIRSGQGDLRLQRGDHPRGIARVERGGAVLWSLSGR